MALAIYALVRGERYERHLFMSLATRKGEGMNSYASLFQVLEMSVNGAFVWIAFINDFSTE